MHLDLHPVFLQVVFWPPRPDEAGFFLLNSDEDTHGHWGMNWPGQWATQVTLLCGIIDAVTVSAAGNISQLPWLHHSQAFHRRPVL